MSSIDYLQAVTDIGKDICDGGPISLSGESPSAIFMLKAVDPALQ